MKDIKTPYCFEIGHLEHVLTSHYASKISMTSLGVTPKNVQMSALIIPLFWSILVPTTPAGQLLQKTQWGTIGFWVILGAALYMT